MLFEGERGGEEDDEDMYKSVWGRAGELGVLELL